jgi:hypothetical protein
MEETPTRRVMKKPYYQITAICNTPTCRGRIFRAERKRVVRTSQSGAEYKTSRVVCPQCRMWADVTKIDMMIK